MALKGWGHTDYLCSSVGSNQIQLSLSSFSLHPKLVLVLGSADGQSCWLGDSWNPKGKRSALLPGAHIHQQGNVKLLFGQGTQNSGLSSPKKGLKCLSANRPVQTPSASAHFYHPAEL